jgi:hypothetical protein
MSNINDDVRTWVITAAETLSPFDDLVFPTLIPGPEGSAQIAWTITLTVPSPILGEKILASSMIIEATPNRETVMDATRRVMEAIADQRSQMLVESKPVDWGTLRSVPE